MARLTERFSNGQAAVAGCGSNCVHDYKYCDGSENCPTLDAIYEKLARYEDLEEKGYHAENWVATGAENKELHKRNKELLKSNEELMAVHEKDKAEIAWLRNECDNQRMKARILEAQMDVVRLIFGGNNNA